MRIARTSRRRGRRRGAVAVEFAIILPLLTTIVLGCVDFGRFAHAYIAVANAARAGAGYASFRHVTAATRAGWEVRTREAVAAEIGTALDTDTTLAKDIISVTVSIEDVDFERVHVEVSYPFTTLVPWPLLPNNVNLTKEVGMRFVR